MDYINQHLEAATIALELVRNSKAFIVIAVPDSGEEIQAAASMLMLNPLEDRGFQEQAMETLVQIFAYGQKGDDDDTDR